MGVLFGCGQGVVFVPEIDSGKLAPMSPIRFLNSMLINFIYMPPRKYIFLSAISIIAT